MGVDARGGGASESVLPVELVHGARIGDWVLRDAIASGGFGQVFEAVHAESGALAAVKVLRRELVADSEAIARFEREADALRRLTIPGVVELFELGRLRDGRPFLAMERLFGSDLNALLARRGRLPLHEALPILAALSETLDHAHRAGIVHRDIKPSNVFLESAGTDRRRVVVLDFGLAKLLEADVPGLTGSRHIVGTPASMAPEQILGNPVDCRTDVYALGALTFQLLAGRPPFHESSLATVCQLHLHARVPSLRSLVSLEVDLDAVIARAMSKDAPRRYATAGEFYAALAAATRGSPGREPVSAPNAIAACVQARLEPDGVDAPEEASLVDLESVLPMAQAWLEDAGFRVLLSAGDTLVAVHDGPERLEAERVSALAIELLGRLERRPNADRRVQIRMCLARTSASGTDDFGAGDLIELLSAGPDPFTRGLFVTRNFVEGRGAPPGSAGDEVFVRVV